MSFLVLDAKSLGVGNVKNLRPGGRTSGIANGREMRIRVVPLILRLIRHCACVMLLNRQCQVSSSLRDIGHHGPRTISRILRFFELPSLDVEEPQLCPAPRVAPREKNKLLVGLSDYLLE